MCTAGVTRTDCTSSSRSPASLSKRVLPSPHSFFRVLSEAASCFTRRETPPSGRCFRSMSTRTTHTHFAAEERLVKKHALWQLIKLFAYYLFFRWAATTRAFLLSAPRHPLTMSWCPRDISIFQRPRELSSPLCLTATGSNSSRRAGARLRKNWACQGAFR